MPYDPDKHHRRTIRLPGYDYTSAGGYFVTICAHNRECIFGEVVDDEMRRNPYGEIVHEEWLLSAEIRAEIVLDAFVVMPNHFHAVVGIVDVDDSGLIIGVRVGAQGRDVLIDAPLPTEMSNKPEFQIKPRSLSTLVRSFKSAVTKRINQLRDTPGIPVWQRNYHERIIRNERHLEAVRTYILNNPYNWLQDEYYPD